MVPGGGAGQRSRWPRRPRRRRRLLCRQRHPLQHNGNVSRRGGGSGEICPPQRVRVRRPPRCKPTVNNAYSSLQGEGLLQVHFREGTSHQSPSGFGGRVRALSDRSQCPGIQLAISTSISPQSAFKLNTSEFL